MVSLVRRGCQRHDRASGVVSIHWCGQSCDSPVLAELESQHVRLRDSYCELLEDCLVAAHHLDRERPGASLGWRAGDLPRNVVLGDRRPVIGSRSRQGQSRGQCAACDGPDVGAVAASGGQQLTVRTIHIAAGQGRRGRDSQRGLVHPDGQGDRFGLRRRRVIGDREDHGERAGLRRHPGDRAGRRVQFQPVGIASHNPCVVTRSARGRERRAVIRAHPAIWKRCCGNRDRIIDVNRARDVHGLLRICTVRHRHGEGEGTRGRRRAGDEPVSAKRQSGGKGAGLEGKRVRFKTVLNCRHVRASWIGDSLHPVRKVARSDCQCFIDVQRQLD